MVKKSRKNANIKKKFIVIDDYHCLKQDCGFIKASYREEHQKFSLAFLNALWFKYNNGRILGYDTRHLHDGEKYGDCHRHLLGVKTAFFPNHYAAVNEIFTRQYPTLIAHYHQYGTFDYYKINA